ncbi:MAG: SipW-dependent-type signal peptide-containing protein [Halobacteriales archaeon]|nr:SipW-dependent-type signal peptide-containing protein [Halobacteriales archaeon]
MTDELPTEPVGFDISRRRVLGGLGAIGLASAGAGLGTSAFFSDEEVFEGNTLTAGALDLKVDWEEHYHLTNEQVPVQTEEGPVDGVLLNDPGDPNYVGFPDPEHPMVWVHMDAIDRYMDLTSIEAYPDSNDDGIQDDLGNYDACEHFADTPEDLDPTVPTPQDALRTFNADTWNGETYNPLVNLDDVKPGDFGELTLSLHLCDNPGYIWMNGGLVEARENGVTEPESSRTSMTSTSPETPPGS